MHAHRTWILIADAAHARILESTGPGHPLAQVPSMTLHADLPPTHELGSDRPGRGHESSGPGRHAVEPRTDAHRELKRDFAELVAERLEAAVAVKAFDKLVIVCPPVMLGDLRAALAETVSDHVVAEIPKDLVRTPNDDIRLHLEPHALV